MKSVGRNKRIGGESAYPAAVMLEACPKCGASPGNKCTKPWGGTTVALVNGHAARVEAARRPF